MVEVTPAPCRLITIADNTKHFEIVCPFCKERQKYPFTPGAIIAHVTHPCNGQTVYFMNNYAFTGVNDYFASEARSRATHP